MGEAGQIMRVNPAAAIPGGEVVVECESFDTSNARTCARLRRICPRQSLNSGQHIKPTDGPRRMTATNPKARAIRNLRWWIGGLLFASTVINYLDRQTLSNLAP